MTEEQKHNCAEGLLMAASDMAETTCRLLDQHAKIIERMAKLISALIEEKKKRGEFVG